MSDSEVALRILRSEERNFEDLEWLARYLQCFEDYRRYTKDISQVLAIQLARLLRVKSYVKKEKVYKKGCVPESWFVVFDGELAVFNCVGSEQKIVSVVGQGKQCGEREILRQKPFAMGCFASKPSNLLLLDSEHFISLLGDQLEYRLTMLRNFVHHYIPYLKSYSWSFKEKIGYIFELNEYKRGENILKIDTIADQLFFVFEGEVAVAVEENFRAKNISKLGIGSCFAEECAFFFKPSVFTIKVSSERAVIASISRDLVYALPDETILALKKNLQDKVQSRISLVKDRKMHKKSNSGTNSPSFKSANTQARGKLMAYILRNRPSTPKRILETNKFKHQDFKMKLQALRDCSPVRLKGILDFQGEISRKIQNKSINF